MPLSNRQKKYLQLMEIPFYQERTEAASQQFDSLPTPETAQKNGFDPGVVKTVSPVNPSVASRKKQIVKPEPEPEIEVSLHDVLKRTELPSDWSGLIDHVFGCKRCKLHETRTQTVFGAGDAQADWMVIGEAPGIEEDKQGEPFVGNAGQLLTSILESIGLSREKVYLANSIKCSPPANRDPKKSELAHCRAYLEQQISMLDPKIIICVGRIASQNLLNSDEPISRLRGRIHHIQHPEKIEKNIPVIVTYHPAYLLRSPSQKRKVWDDLKLALSVTST